MARQLDGKIAEVLKKYEFGKDACWDCHGTWVVYHRVLEAIAAKAGISFDNPYPMEAKGVEKCVAICVTGNLGDKSEWSIGEAAPANNKNAYPYAMAEKRGKDRVILKLIGLHGLVFSEEEADAFANAKKEPVLGELTKTKLQAALREFDGDLRRVSDIEEFQCLLAAYKDTLAQAEMDLPTWWYGKEGSDVPSIKDRIEEKRLQLEAKEPNTLDGG